MNLKSFDRVVVKVPTPNQKRPDTPVKKAAPVVEEVAPEVRAPAAQAPSTSTESSLDSGCVSNLDLDNQVADYADFENEVMFVSCVRVHCVNLACAHHFSI